MAKKIKKAVKKGVKKRSHNPSTKMAGGGVRIRMYRQGLGDCFLIRFEKPDRNPFHVVIDCGVLIGSPDGSARIKKIVENINAETGGEIDLLIATHEHTDHLSGFNSARELWNSMAIKRTWMAWTENLSKAEIKDLKSSQRLRLRAALAGGRRLEAARFAINDPEQGIKLQKSADEIYNLLQFALDGDEPDDFLSPGADVKLTGPARALQWLKEKAGSSIEYCHPTDPPRMLDGLDGVRVFTLGPPDGPLLRHSDPSPGEAYELFGGLANNDLSFALAAADDDEESLKKIFGAASATAQPFDIVFQRTAEQVERAPQSAANGEGFFENYYGFDPDHPNAWRKIDFDWLNISEAMALALTGHINNTSLVLAFELGEAGPVLLFPGDAQAGSWSSWSDVKWEVASGTRSRSVTGPDLLRRTVFYKVGHHGSHNATAKDKGLELMVHPDLVAFIPVHQKTAWKQDPPWKMPWQPLWDRLKDRANHRVILSDADETIESQLSAADLPTDASFVTEWKGFRDALQWDESNESLWIDYRLR